MERRESSSDEVVPDDSASQAEGKAGPHRPIKTVHPAQVANISTTVQPRGGQPFVTRTTLCVRGELGLDASEEIVRTGCGIWHHMGVIEPQGNDSL